ncbi:hypothetical protein FG173_02735 [Serratia marcescens]|nr:hypothetical protein FG173_02735 [Serratia marcescens]
MGLAVWRPVLLKKASGAPKCKNVIVYMLNNSQVAAAGKAVALQGKGVAAFPSYNSPPCPNKNSVVHCINSNGYNHMKKGICWMTLKYYLKHILWGLVITAVAYYAWSKNPEDSRLTLILSLSVASCVLYPFAKFAIEKTALRYSHKKFWQHDFFVSSVGGSIEVVYELFCFAFAIPVSVIYFSLSILKALKRN